MTRKKILFVAIAHSIHAAHWMNLLAESGEFEVLLYSSLYVPPHSSLNPTIKVFYPSLIGNSFTPTGKFHTLRRIIDIARCRSRASDHQPVAPLVRLIEQQQPDIVHGLEFQHSCYLASKAMQKISGKRPVFGVTNWGSDIYYFRQFRRHMAQIKKLLNQADFYSCECARDIEIVKSLGFTGKIWPVIPGSAGLNMSVIENILKNAAPPSQRKHIMIKGYQHFAGRALTTLAALKECLPELKGYSLILFSAPAHVKKAYAEFASSHNIPIEYPKGITQNRMLENYSRSRCFISTGVTDGISTSVLEAMSVGCFPIQTSDSCCEEWFENKKTGYITKASDIATIISAIKRSLLDDMLVDSAAPVNQNTIAKRCDDRLIQKLLLSEYRALC